MKRMTLSVILWTLMLPAAGSAEPAGAAAKRTWSFDDDKPGETARGFTAEVGEWKVVEDAAAPSGKKVFAQLAKSPRPAFNVALAREAKPKDVEITVKMKPVAGEVDQGGGVVWRARDAKNYYIARYNPLEGNFRLYKVEDGKRTQLATAEVKPAEGWRTLRVVMKDDRMECFLDGKKHLEAQDSTFKEAGAVGLWTKADAKTHFDDLAASEPAPAAPAGKNP